MVIPSKFNDLVKYSHIAQLHYLNGKTIKSQYYKIFIED